MVGLKHLAAYRESTLLVTNLRPALLPPDRRATPKRQPEYDEILALHPGTCGGEDAAPCRSADRSSCRRKRTFFPMSKTLFQRIIDREIPAKIEYEDDQLHRRFTTSSRRRRCMS